MFKTPLTRRSIERVENERQRADRLAMNATATSRAVKARKADLIKKGLPVVVLVATGAYFGKRLIDRYRYHRKIRRFENAREHEAEGSVTMSAEELARADREQESGGLTVFDVLNGAIAVLALLRRVRVATEKRSDTAADRTSDEMNRHDPL